MDNFLEDEREALKQMYPACDYDVSYNFFYDETNNIRKYHNEGGKLNYKGEGNFILGGIVFDKEPELEELFESLKLQETITEVKFKHIAKGDFFTTLKSNKLYSILSFFKEKEVYIHYSSINLMYFAIVDIIDSSILGSGYNFTIQEANELKSILYDALASKIDKTAEIFHYFDYPNVKKENFKKFIYHIKKTISSYKLYKTGIEQIKELLDTAVSNNSLEFITDEKSNVFIEHFFPFYHQPVSVFINSNHYFDDEETIRQAFEMFESYSSEKPHGNYIFQDSKSSRLTQLADVTVGIIGKFSQYINTTNKQSVIPDYQKLEETQKKNYSLFVDVLNKTLSKNPAFINHIMSLTQHEIFSRILEEIK